MFTPSVIRSLGHHCSRNLHEASDVGSVDEVTLAVEFFSCTCCGRVNIGHDALETIVDFLASPFQTHGVLRHLESRDCDTACIGCLCRPEHDAVVDEDFNTLSGGRHVCAFRDTNAPVVHEVLRVNVIEFVLRCRGQGISALTPQTGLLPSAVLDSMYVAVEYLSAYSRIRPRRTFFRSITYSSFSRSIPASSTMTHSSPRS